MEDLFNIIGKLYVDIYNSQKVIEILQKQLKDKENEVIRNTSVKERDD